MSIDRRFPPDAYVIYKDGNCWFAVRTDFVDLQASHSGVGDSPREAMDNLLDVEKAAVGGARCGTCGVIAACAWEYGGLPMCFVCYESVEGNPKPKPTGDTEEFGGSDF